MMIIGLVRFTLCVRKCTDNETNVRVYLCFFLSHKRNIFWFKILQRLTRRIRTIYICLVSPQVTNFWNKVLNEAERTRLVNNIAGHLKDAKEFLQKRAVSAGVNTMFVTSGLE